jgi:DNA-binding XRE family transcriptional regulator
MKTWATDIETTRCSTISLQYRAKHNMTQTQLAEFLGCHRSTISKIEQKKPTTLISRIKVLSLASDL